MNVLYVKYILGNSLFQIFRVAFNQAAVVVLTVIHAMYMYAFMTVINYENYNISQDHKKGYKLQISSNMYIIYYSNYEHESAYKSPSGANASPDPQKKKNPP